jgi:hypothetical protein
MDSYEELEDFYEAEDDDEIALAAAAFFTVVVLGIENSRLERADRRRSYRCYLCRPELIPNPCYNTSWQALYASRQDRAFITTMGVDVHTFHFLLAAGFEDLWNTTPIPREDTNSNGTVRLGARYLDAAGALGLYLHYISSAMADTGLQPIFALVSSTVSRYQDFAQDLLLTTLRNLEEAAICWGVGDDFEIWTSIIQVRVMSP